MSLPMASLPQRSPERGSDVPARSSSRVRDAAGEQAAIVRHIARRMGKRLLALHDPEDLLQDALLQALERRRLEDLSLLSWGLVTRLAEFRVLTLAAQGRHRTTPRGSTALPPSMLVLDLAAIEQSQRNDDDADVLGKRDLAERTLRAMQELPFDQRACLVLRELQGLEWRNVAALMEYSPRKARKVHLRAVRSLRQRLRGSA